MPRGDSLSSRFVRADPAQRQHAQRATAALPPREATRYHSTTRCQETYATSRGGSKVIARSQTRTATCAQSPSQPLSLLLASRETDRQRRPLHADIRLQPVRPYGATQPIVVAATRPATWQRLWILRRRTNASVRLEPALTLAGRITDLNGKSHYQRSSTGAVPYRADVVPSRCSGRANAEGRFEIKGLPPGRQYSINTSAKGSPGTARFGALGHRDQPCPARAFPTDASRPTHRRRRLDDSDKPSRAPPSTPMATGNPTSTPRPMRRTVHHGQGLRRSIQLSANSRSGGYANVNADGGDTNIVIRMSTSRGMRMASPRSVASRQALPDSLHLV